MAPNARIPDSGDTARDEGHETHAGSGQNADVETAALTLSREDSLRFAKALLDPPAPNERLREALRAHREFIAN